jgi:hypothetical protein
MAPYVNGWNWNLCPSILFIFYFIFQFIFSIWEFNSEKATYPQTLYSCIMFHYFLSAYQLCKIENSNPFGLVLIK